MARQRRIEQAQQRVEQQFNRWGAFTPAVAEAVTYHHEPTVAFTSPSADQIKQESFWARTVSGFLGFFSPRWAERFDRYLERNGRQRITTVASRITTPLDAIGSFAAPKKQFLREVADMYQYVQADDVVGDELNTTERSEDKLPKLVRGLWEAPSRLNRKQNRVTETQAQEVPVGSKELHAHGQSRFPLLGNILPSFGVPGVAGFTITEQQWLLKAATPEIMKGVERFLGKHGVDTATYESTPPSSIGRRIIERFARKKLEQLPAEVEAALTQIYGVLPQDGRKFSQNVYNLCKEISHLAQTGVDGRTITKTLLKNFRV